MELKLPDGGVLMHGKRPYDPAKAREYYLRTRKLNGRKKAAAQKDPTQVKYRAKLDAFLRKLPMAKEGASVEETEKFVDSFRGKSDEELKAAAKNMKNTPGRQDAQIKAQTVMALLENRNRVRSQKADAKKMAKKNTQLKAETKPRVPKKTVTRTG